MNPTRRVKTYSGQTGFVYQYVFVRQKRVRRGWLRPGTEYLFEVSADRKTSFHLPVFVRDDALSRWRERHGRPLSSTEQYAAAKMRLFRAFDEVEHLAEKAAEIVVDPGNIEQLLSGLDIC